MELGRHSLLSPLIRWLVGSLTALLLTLPALEGFGAAPLAWQGSGQPRNLSFEERVAAQKAIEEVLWRHRIWPNENPGPKPTLDKVLPDSAIRDRVTDYLKKSNALEKLWNRPLTAEQLQAEMDRMAKNTRDPEMLREVFAALHDDPFLIAECLARPSLADRFLRTWYSADRRFHGETRAHAERERARLETVEAMRGTSGRYSEATWMRADDSQVSSPEAGSKNALELSDAEYRTLLQELSAELGSASTDSLPIRRLSPLKEDDDSFFAAAVLSLTDDSVSVARITWPKKPFGEWWLHEADRLSTALVIPATAYAPAAIESSGCVDRSWSPVSSLPPAARYLHAAVWTGSEMVIWGGVGASSAAISNGAQYDPALDLWHPLPAAGRYVPRAGVAPLVAWTGTYLLVFNYYPCDPNVCDSPANARYNLLTQTWSLIGFSGDIEKQSGIWTGSEFILWGGRFGSTYLNAGFRYNPDTNTGISTSTGPGVPSGRYVHSAVWTGSEMIVWGGADAGGYLNSGARYNPSSNTWTPLAVDANTPSPRFRHAAVWAGNRMIVWGGDQAGQPPLNNGARYDPGTNSWSSMVASPLAGRRDHTGVSTGTELIVWGGFNGVPLGDGARYDPATDLWSPVNAGPSAPQARYVHTAVWTGSEMLVWGGADSADTPLDTGARYRPSDDSWSPISSARLAPSPRRGHTAVWTGTEMIVWGGDDAASGFTPTNTGGRYDPFSDSWSATSVGAGVPSSRAGHTAVWTGTEMIVWSGSESSSTRTNTGGRYSPASDSWSATSVEAGTPSARSSHTAVWTGTEMIVWGGSESSSTRTNTGGRYSPASDSWSATSVGAETPTARSSHTAVWTGTEMVIWGGLSSPFSSETNTGGRYSPSSDTWQATLVGVGTPSVRSGHTVVWTGTKMIVWGGQTGFGPTNTGGLYDPSDNSWSPTSTGANLPQGRPSHTAVWTGNEMIVWGGINANLDNTVKGGGIYNPSTNSWAPMDPLLGPASRNAHTAVWTGTSMIVWGGSFLDDTSVVPFSAILDDGSQFCRTCSLTPFHPDADADTFGSSTSTALACDPVTPPGFTSDASDCNDASNVIYPGAPQICDGLNDDCSDPSWPTVPANEANADGDAFRICQGDCDDSRATVYPGAPQLCDGLNNDCLDGTWPTMPGNETDQDGDGFRVCTPDCWDANPQVWASPIEIPTLTVSAGTPTTLTWPSQSVLAGPETSYDLVGGTLTSPAGFIDFSAASCLQPLGPTSFSDTRANPATGTAYWYVARAQNSCGVGTYGNSSFGPSYRDESIPACP